MPPKFLIIIIILLLGSWFLLGEKRSFLEKLTMLFALLFAYVAYRLMSGATIQDILTPLTQGIRF